MNTLLTLGLAASLITGCATAVNNAADERALREAAATAAVMGYRAPIQREETRQDR